MSTTHLNDNAASQNNSTQALLEQAILRLAIRKGYFPLDLSLGSELYSVKTTANLSKQRLLPIVTQALAPISEISVNDLDFSFDYQKNLLKLSVDLTVLGENKILEVAV